ncbi:TPA: hypothetical protein DCZ15_04255 [Candidatus Falkowbacteria bacterium]|nr:MAG: hypothetical protein UV95_C0001G0323 [Candidatus Falkowbacteria bacterium GW2011_GWF2_43_32]HBA37048.1 hypothetical protein [Candidatus Falkowbacteria bacterium]
MQNLLTLDYWFNLRPETLTPLAQKLFIGLLIGLAILAIIIAFLKKWGGLYRGFLKRLYNFCLANAVIGLLLFFFNYEVIPFLSARFWLGIWAISLIVWLIFVLKSLARIPRIKKEHEQNEELKKYIP